MVTLKSLEHSGFACSTFVGVVFDLEHPLIIIIITTRFIPPTCQEMDRAAPPGFFRRICAAQQSVIHYCCLHNIATDHYNVYDP